MKEKDRKSDHPSDGTLNIIGKGTVIQGNVTAAGDMRVEGRITGTVVCKSRLVLSSEGFIEGNIDAVQANLAGEVKGIVVARQLLHIQETGKILGDIFTEKLIVQLGAFFTGNCRMGKVDANPDLLNPNRNNRPENIVHKIISDKDSLATAGQNEA